MTLLREEVEALRQNGITAVAFPRLNDPDIIPLWFGEGDAVTADFIRDAAKQALDEGNTFYTHTCGHESLRSAIKAYLDRLYGVDVHPERITVPGATMLGITMAAQMALTSGSHGLIVSPNWPNIDLSFRVTGAEVGYVRQKPQDGKWVLDMEELKAAVQHNTKAIFVNSPCNPTGWIMPVEQQVELLELCRERDILLIADEVYHRCVFEGESAPSFLSIANDEDPVIVINGFSKAWAMTGWRLGWLVAPRRYNETLAVMSECFNTGSTVFTQPAGIVALEQGEDVVKTLRAQYAKGREAVTSILGNHPAIEYMEPEGAFYAFPRLKGITADIAFAGRLADEGKVGVSPGTAFGPGNEQHIRLCFAQSI
ncbi:MAG: aminotransferase class I/II-fold pyridoxal phosphate-dependent enzyme, partial [Pseudomonadota bacterium]